jgi:hypothetical protein
MIRMWFTTELFPQPWFQVLRFHYKWEHVMFVFLCLVCFTQYKVGLVEWLKWQRACIASVRPWVLNPGTTHTYINTHTHTHIYTCMHTYTHTCTHIHTFIHTYTKTHKHTHIHTHIHTYTHIHIQPWHKVLQFHLGWCKGHISLFAKAKWHSVLHTPYFLYPLIT